MGGVVCILFLWVVTGRRCDDMPVARQAHSGSTPKPAVFGEACTEGLVGGLAEQAGALEKKSNWRCQGWVMPSVNGTGCRYFIGVVVGWLVIGILIRLILAVQRISFSLTGRTR